MMIMLLSLGLAVQAQEVISNGQVYEVKGKAIFQDGVDITSTLQTEEKDKIFKIFNDESKNLKAAEKARKKLEKSAKEAQKAQKKAEKALKKKQKAEDQFKKASKKLKEHQSKFDKLKAKGKLSPNDEAKWLKKLEGYKKDVEKAKRKI